MKLRLNKLVAELQCQKYDELSAEVEYELRQHNCFGCPEWEACREKRGIVRHATSDLMSWKARQN